MLHIGTTGIDVLKFLLEEHQLAPSDLPEIGNQDVLSELLAGKRELSVDHIRALSKHLAYHQQRERFRLSVGPLVPS